MDLDNHVILPREDFLEMQSAAMHVSTSVSDRVAGTLHTTAVLTVMSAAIVGTTWGVAKAMDWFETRRLARERTTNVKPTFPSI